MRNPATVIVTQKTTAGGYTWGYGTSSTGYTGWIVVDNDWTTLVSSTADTTAPTISEVQVYDVSSSGYTVSCKVSDNKGVTRVAFPTWTINNGQDDLFSNWSNTALGTVSNGVATYRVNTSDHNGETGCTYLTHIYAYDAAGNAASVSQSNYGALQVEVPSPTINTTGIGLDLHSVDVDLGNSGSHNFALTATIYPSNATNKTVHWSSSDPSVARVDGNGVVTPVSIGTATITAMAENGGYQDTCTVNMSYWINQITLDAAQARLNLDRAETLKLTNTITPGNATDRTVAWTSSDETVATVSPDGLVAPVGEGVAVVTCAAQDPSGLFARCSVTVYRDVEVTSVSVNRSRIAFDSVAQGGSAALNVTLSPENATRTGLTWTSSNTAVASVEYGVVTPRGPGYARITCTAESGAAAVCDVIVHADNVLKLPAALQDIEKEAFLGASIEEVIVPKGAASIGAKAFANCEDLALVYIPSSVTSIASDSFKNSKNVAFVCDDTCVATFYAQSKGIPCIVGTMPKEVLIVAYDDTLVLGESIRLYSIVLPDDAPQGVRWSIIEGASLATIQPMGDECELTARGTGTVTVAGTAFNGTVGTVEINIVEHPTAYNVWFDANGGEVNADYITAKFDAAIGELPTPTREYHAFVGWYTSAGGGTRVTPDTVFADYDMGDITLYAHWTRLTSTVSFDANGGTCDTPSRTVDQGDAIGALPAATRPYYTFNGWYTAVSGGTKVEASAVYTANATLHAQWTLNGFGAWSGWSTTAVTGNDNRQVETEVRQVQTGTNTTYHYERYLYWYSAKGYYQASYGSNWATSNGYSGSWQYATSSTPWPVDHTTDGRNVYSGETRDGNRFWYNESVTTEPVYSSVTYYRYRDRIQ